MEWVSSSTYIITKIYLHEKVACSAVVFLHRINTKNAIWTSSTPVLCVLGSTRCRWDGRSANVCESTIDITPRLMRAIALCRCSCTRTRSSDGSHKDTTKEVGGKCFNSTIPHNQTHFHRCTSKDTWRSHSMMPWTDEGGGMHHRANSTKILSNSRRMIKCGKMARYIS